MGVSQSPFGLERGNQKRSPIFSWDMHRAPNLRHTGFPGRKTLFKRASLWDDAKGGSSSVLFCGLQLLFSQLGKPQRPLNQEGSNAERDVHASRQNNLSA